MHICISSTHPGQENDQSGSWFQKGSLKSEKEYLLRIVFDHSPCQSIHSQIQNRPFKKLLLFNENSFHKASVCLRVVGLKRMLIVRIQFDDAFFFSLTLKVSKINSKFYFWGTSLSTFFLQWPFEHFLENVRVFENYDICQSVTNSHFWISTPSVSLDSESVDHRK